jgi:hypothetical protein
MNLFDVKKQKNNCKHVKALYIDNKLFFAIGKCRKINYVNLIFLNFMFFFIHQFISFTV